MESTDQNGNKIGEEESNDGRTVRKRGRPAGKKSVQENQEAEDETVEAGTRGRPLGSKSAKVVPDQSIFCQSETRSAVLFASTSSTPPRPPSTTKPSNLSELGTSSRPKHYLLESEVAGTLPSSKLPKNKHILRRFLDLFGGKAANIKRDNEKKYLAMEVSKEVAAELRDVWSLHFGFFVVHGKEAVDQVKEDENLKMVIRQDNIEAKIAKLYQDYNKLKIESRKAGRCESANFKKKEKAFEDHLDTPMDISKKNAEEILKDSPIMNWREDWEHLQNQVKRDQAGSLGCKDTKQQKRDKRAEEDKKSAEAAAQKSNSEVKQMFEKKRNVDDDGVEDNDCDENYSAKKRKLQAQKIDVMGVVSNTGDRLGLSVRQKAMFAAAVVKSVGVDIKDTNISFATAAKKAKKVRIETEKEVLHSFVPPDHVVVHWDGKVLKLKAGAKAEHICVYISGADASKVTKLLGVPEVDSGSGQKQKEAAVEMLIKWNIFEQIVGLVFDTTSSNTGSEIGACKLLEDYLEKAVLWLACRHHIYELHIKHVVEAVTGMTKDPGVKSFRRLKSEWNSLRIDYSMLVKFDYEESSSWLCDQARKVLAWAEDHYMKGTWPRNDYKELLELVIIWLGGKVQSFTFKFPGADHHARWLSKAIYYMKLALLSAQFVMEEKEKGEVAIIAEFVGLFYSKAFFKCPLPSAAPSTDLLFMSEVMQYRLIHPKLAFQCLQSCYRHLWYLTPSLVVLALADKDTIDSDKEEMGKKLFSIPRPKTISPGKPVFPVIPWGEKSTPPSLSTFVSEESWLLFDLLGLDGNQEWLQTPVRMWEMFGDFRKFKVFAENVSVVNDLAERGMHLITEFASKCYNKEERQALLQVVEQHRQQFPGFSKKTLSGL